jgi:hypothetical protein
MTNFDPTSWLQKNRIEKRLNTSVEPKPVAVVEEPILPVPPTTESLTTAISLNATGASVPLWQRSLEEFYQRLVSEQLRHPEELLKLNRTRRESLARFLTELSSQPEPADLEQTLQNFVRPERNPAEHEAIRQLFKQIAFVQIGKALLLKSWDSNPSANLPLTKNDLKDLTSAVERGLRTFMHLQTTVAQLVQKNFYSWYKLSTSSQDTLWSILKSIEITDEVQTWLLNQAIKLSADTLGERDRYQDSFYRNLWKHIQAPQILEPRIDLYRNQGIPIHAFCPTLRDGSVLQYAPDYLEWIGFEPLTFELIFAEIRVFWDRPKPPSLWIRGSGLEMCMEPQANLLVTNSGRQNVLQQMDGIESCEVAFITEENIIRTQSRTMAGSALRKEIDQHPILKKIKQPQTTRGTYQACQSLGKLRQGGVMIWAREELLCEESGKPALQFILNEARLLMIADLTALTSESDRLKFSMPKALYIFKKETRVELRKNHRPLLIKAYGSLKTDVDVTTLFDRIFASLEKPELVFPAEPFSIHARLSPVAQSEWEHHWLNPSDDQMVERIEDLKRSAIPLVQMAVIRTVHSVLSDTTESLGLFQSEEILAQSGFYLWVETDRRNPHSLTSTIQTASMNHRPQHIKPGTPLFFVAPNRPEWDASLQMLVRSAMMQDWLNYSVERKKGSWILRENEVKSMPIPKHLFDFLNLPDRSIAFSSAEEQMLGLIATQPSQAHRQLEPSFHHRPALRGAAFKIAAETLLAQEQQQAALFSLVLSEDQIDFPRLIESFSAKNDICSLDQHPLIRFNPSLPTHLPIQHVTLIKNPTPGILLANQKGLTQPLYIQNTWLRDYLFSQIQQKINQLGDCTFLELTRSIPLPKTPETVLQLGSQCLQSFSQLKMKRKELNHLIGACMMSEELRQPDLGLLQ